MTRHATAARATDLGNAPNGLGVMDSDGIADFLLGDIQTMTERPMRVGVARACEGVRVTEVHGKHSTERG